MFESHLPLGRPIVACREHKVHAHLVPLPTPLPHAPELPLHLSPSPHICPPAPHLDDVWHARQRLDAIDVIRQQPLADIGKRRGRENSEDDSQHEAQVWREKVLAKATSACCGSGKEDGEGEGTKNVGKGNKWWLWQPNGWKGGSKISEWAKAIKGRPAAVAVAGMGE
eukprot:214880-Chlamydomonas_euryale.AAC.2